MEGHLNLNLEGDIRIGLTGELALSVSDLTRFNLESINNINLDTSFELDASGVETNGCLIFNPSHRMKWNQMGNSLSNRPFSSTKCLYFPNRLQRRNSINSIRIRLKCLLQRDKWTISYRF